jgi:hypothetical protein
MNAYYHPSVLFFLFPPFVSSLYIYYTYKHQARRKHMIQVARGDVFERREIGL